ncbi:dihydrofolate reductase [Xanthobacter agilis]|jgi:dihydrofolate reductase|uniref:Dihydrofolate reductase n=1 Tax=Xanthobacter agilis TaxID=47492 RepID=A0ABU0LD25_XANAG|nr:dihydrofolate reductase [Xanthobacter agilis]MDQ0505044.1 dihydrofolate reductase [Xanthobacter agilis]
MTDTLYDPLSIPLAVIVAVAANGVIGRAGALPWHLSSDLKRFRALTWGKPLIMGRRTFESIGKPLPGRVSVVLSADPSFTVPEGVVKVPDLVAAIAAAESAARTMGAGEIMVIGGARVFAETLPLARVLHLTEVDMRPEGDVHFPTFDRAPWREISREGPLRGDRDDAAFSYVTLERR